MWHIYYRRKVLLRPCNILNLIEILLHSTNHYRLSLRKGRLLSLKTTSRLAREDSCFSRSDELSSCKERLLSLKTSSRLARGDLVSQDELSSRDGRLSSLKASSRLARNETCLLLSGTVQQNNLYTCTKTMK